MNGVTPGTYVLRAMSSGPRSPDTESALTEITVGDADLSGVALVGVKPVSVSGRIIVDESTAAFLPKDLVVQTFPMKMETAIYMPQQGRVGDDRTFELKTMPGQVRLVISGAGFGSMGNWTMRTIRWNGTDVTDAGIAIKPNEPVSGLEIELSNKTTTVLGVVTSAGSNVAKDYTALAFARDKEKWTPGARSFGIGRPDQDGRFKISNLPPGDYFLIAVDQIEPGRWFDPEFLERARDRATAFSLREGETRTIDLRLQSNIQ